MTRRERRKVKNIKNSTFCCNPSGKDQNFRSKWKEGGGGKKKGDGRVVFLCRGEKKGRGIRKLSMGNRGEDDWWGTKGGETKENEGGGRTSVNRTKHIQALP